MSAKTRQTDEKGKFVKLLARLGGLCAQAFILIESGKRGKEQVKLMLHALQLFKEDRLGWVAEGVKRLTQLSSSELIGALSAKLEELPLSQLTRTFFTNQGILYLGEALLVERGREGRALHLWNKEWRELNAWLSQHGISWELDPWDFDWTPPYWPDPALRKHLELSAQEAINFPANTDTSTWHTLLVGYDLEPPDFALAMDQTRVRTERLWEFFGEVGRHSDEHRRALLQRLLKPGYGLHAGMALIIPVYFAHEELDRYWQATS